MSPVSHSDRMCEIRTPIFALISDTLGMRHVDYARVVPIPCCPRVGVDRTRRCSVERGASVFFSTKRGHPSNFSWASVEGFLLVCVRIPSSALSFRIRLFATAMLPCIHDVISGLTSYTVRSSSLASLHFRKHTRLIRRRA